MNNNKKKKREKKYWKIIDTVLNQTYYKNKYENKIK